MRTYSGGTITHSSAVTPWCQRPVTLSLSTAGSFVRSASDTTLRYLALRATDSCNCTGARRPPMYGLVGIGRLCFALEGVSILGRLDS